jgi:hypothetical protein
MKLRDLFLLTLAAALTAQLPIGCVFEDGPSTETGNPNIQGTIRDEQGRPVIGTVKLFMLSRSADPDSATLAPPQMVGRFTTDGDGKYLFDSLPRSVYSIEAVDAGRKIFGLKPRVASVTGTKPVVADLTIKIPAVIKGKVTRGPNPFPAGITDHGWIRIRLGGADREAVTDSVGNYTLWDVPEGIYRVAFLSPDGPYEPAFLDAIKAESGDTVTLPLIELTWSRFMAPPSPSGLAIAIDSLTGAIRVTWHPVKLANLAYYEVARIDSLDAGQNAVFKTGDSIFVDTILPIANARSLSYRITAVNSLGNRSEAGPAQTRPAVTPVKPDTVPIARGYLAGLLRYNSGPVRGTKVMLYAVPAAPGSPDSMPLNVRLLDSAKPDEEGRYRFRALGGPDTWPIPGSVKAGAGAQARYAVASSVPGLGVIRTGLAARADSLVLDTLDLEKTGTVEGQASRDNLWVRTPFKSDEEIPVHLAGTPYSGRTRFTSVFPGATFTLDSVPAGRYRLVVHADPEGYFLPDTLDVTVAPGAVTKIPGPIKARYNPNAPPPKIATLTLASGTRASVRLAWTAIGNYPQLKGYRVLRLDANLAESARSGMVTAAEWTDEIAALPSGSTWYYVVRVVNQLDKEGANGGDASGSPIPFTVP